MSGVLRGLAGIRRTMRCIDGDSAGWGSPDWLGLCVRRMYSA